MVFNFLPDYFNVNMRLCVELCVGSFQVRSAARLFSIQRTKPLDGMETLRGGPPIKQHRELLMYFSQFDINRTLSMA
jgi:hypothetical protein